MSFKLPCLLFFCLLIFGCSQSPPDTVGKEPLLEIFGSRNELIATVDRTGEVFVARLPNRAPTEVTFQAEPGRLKAVPPTPAFYKNEFKSDQSGFYLTEDGKSKIMSFHEASGGWNFSLRTKKHATLKSTNEGWTYETLDKSVRIVMSQEGDDFVYRKYAYRDEQGKLLYKARGQLSAESMKWFTVEPLGLDPSIAAALYWEFAR